MRKSEGGWVARGGGAGGIRVAEARRGGAGGGKVAAAPVGRAGEGSEESGCAVARGGCIRCIVGSSGVRKGGTEWDCVVEGGRVGREANGRWER